ncbi:hypothetical protein FRB93_003431 [Tulasnella sp. JGI-2019a]|nr:hypothetical protein FRB93_003431 [Tulasnella sp. JGI-2019a]
MSSATTIHSLDTMTRKDLIDLTCQGTNVSRSDVEGVWATIAALLMASSSGRSVGLGFLPSAQALITSDASRRQLSAETRTFLATLANAAHDAGTALYCSSILGGPGSESDQFSDCAIYLGEPSTNIDAKTSLGKESIAQWAVEVVGLGTSSAPKVVSAGGEAASGPSPISLQTVPALQREKAEASISKLERLLSQLEDVAEFRVHGADTGEPNLHFMLGKGVGGWQGLVGASVWSDD